MKTAAEVIQEHLNKPENKVGVSSVIIDAMKEYAREVLKDIQSMIQGNDLEGIDEYISKVKENLP